jgi:hypothetical protein
MLHRFRERFGTAGLIVGLLALVLALGGTALAASGALTGKQKKEVEKIAKKYAGTPGAPGATGPAGPAGPAGGKGDTGAPGTNGTSVTNTNEPAGANCAEGGTKLVGTSTTYACNGKKGTNGAPGKEGSPWTAGGTLPEKATETGVWGQGEVAGTAVGFRFYPISFALPLSAKPTTEFVGPTVVSTANCPGRGAEPIGIPKAEPGFLCVYASSMTSTGVVAFRAPTFASGEGANVAGSSQVGSILKVFCESEECQALGIWAVTAPEE